MLNTCLPELSDNSPDCVAVGYLNLGDNNYEDNLVGYHITKSSESARGKTDLQTRN